MLPFSVTLNDPNPDFNGYLTLDISVTVQDRHSYNGILIGTYAQTQTHTDTHTTQRYNFK